MSICKKNIVRYINEKIGIEINENSILPRDLKIKGLDAEIFFSEFFNYFEIDGRLFDYDKYNLNDSADMSFFSRAKISIRKKSKEEFNLDHLVIVVQKKRWFDPS